MSNLKDKYPGLYRLARVADALLSVDPQTERFDLSSWLEGDPNRPTCGTTACALGWGVLKHGKEIGLRFYNSDGRWIPETIADGSFGSLWRHGSLDLDALGKHFDISAHRADQLFGGLPNWYQQQGVGVKDYPTARQAGEAICKYVEKTIAKREKAEADADQG